MSDLPDQRHALCRLADKINRDTFEQAFSALYSSDNGRPAKQARLMCRLLILKHTQSFGRKSAHRLKCNFYRYLQGDAVNIMPAAAFNFKKAMRLLV